MSINAKLASVSILNISLEENITAVAVWYLCYVFVWMCVGVGDIIENFNTLHKLPKNNANVQNKYYFIYDTIIILIHTVFSNDTLVTAT